MEWVQQINICFELFSGYCFPGMILSNKAHHHQRGGHHYSSYQVLFQGNLY